MITIDKNKRGFSLIEALVSMLILSVFLGATAKVWTKRNNVDKTRFPHGYFECYYDASDKLHMHKLYNQESVREELTGSYCDFKPGGEGFIYSVIIVHPTPASMTSYDCGGKDEAENPIYCGAYLEVVPFMNGILRITPGTKSNISTTIKNVGYQQYGQDVGTLTFNPKYSGDEFQAAKEVGKMSYSEMRNSLRFNNSGSDIYTKNVGSYDRNGGVIISW